MRNNRVKGLREFKVTQDVFNQRLNDSGDFYPKNNDGMKNCGKIGLRKRLNIKIKG